MSDERTHAEKTSVEKKSIGFDYQYFYFLLKCLCLKQNETIGLEVMDDVHTSLNTDRQILVQLKHTLEKKADGSPANLATLDSDLWKSLSNWAKLICDKKDGRQNLAEQVTFVSKTDFLLVTNKSDNKSNTFLNNLRKFSSGEIDFASLRNQLIELKDKTDSDSVKAYIQDVLNLDDRVLTLFMNNLEFDLNQDNLILRCKAAIKEKMVPEAKVDKVFSQLDSVIKSDNFLTVKDGKKILLTFDQFYKKYRKYFDLARNEVLSVRVFNKVLPDKLENQTFIRQLIDISDITVNDIDEIIEYSRYKIKTENNIDSWILEGELTREESELFHKDAILAWKNKFKEMFRGSISKDKINERALAVLDFIRQKMLKISSQDLDLELSNGKYYCLSDTPEIGWRNDWESRYKK